MRIPTAGRAVFMPGESSDNVKWLSGLHEPWAEVMSQVMETEIYNPRLFAKGSELLPNFIPVDWFSANHENSLKNLFLWPVAENRSYLISLLNIPLPFAWKEMLSRDGVKLAEVGKNEGCYSGRILYQKIIREKAQKYIEILM